MPRLHVACVLASLLFYGASAAADSSLDACSAAAVDGQKLERAGKLLEAKARYETCSKPDCRGDIVADCSSWLAQVSSRTPSILVDLRDERGSAISDAVVSVDGNVVVAADLSKPIPLDPGAHTVTCERGPGVRIVRNVDLHEGQRADVSVVFAPPPQPSSESPRSLPKALYVTGGMAAVGLVTFGISAGLGYADWNDSGCEVRCGSDDASRVRTKLVVADIALGIGVAAALLTAGLYLFGSPSAPRARSTATMAEAARGAIRF